MDVRGTIAAVGRLALPVIAQSLLHTLVFLVDRAMLGRYSADALASMQISGPVAWSCYSILSAFAVGTVALVGRAVGAGDARLATAAARASLLLAVLTGTGAAVVGVLGLDGILAIFPAAGPGVRTAAVGYLGVVFPGMPLFIVSIAAGSVMQAAGNTRIPFLAAAAGNVVNVALNWVLIFGNLGAPELGAVGAAIASVAAMAVSVAILLVVLGRGGAPVRVWGGGGERDAMKRIWRVALPAFGERVVAHVGFMGFVAMIGALGDAAMAANQALISIESVCFLSADGFGIAAAAVVSQRLGAGRANEAALGARVAVAMALALLGSFALLFLIFPAALLGAFSDDAAIVALGVPCLYVAAAAQPFMSVSIVLAEALRGAGATRIALVVALVGGVGVRLGATWLFAFHMDFGLVGVWIGSTCDWAVRSVLLGLFFAAGRWRGVEV